LRDFELGQAKPLYQSRSRSLHNLPSPRRDLIKRNNYLVPNSIVVSRGCPHHCDFCYKDSFFRGGKSFYTQRVDDALSEISRLRGRHLYFLDDHLFASEAFALSLLKGMRGMNRLWQAAGTIQSVLRPGLMAEAAKSGLKSLFLGFETVNKGNLTTQNKLHNMNDYTKAIHILRDLGVMINGSFVFGMDEDQPDVFERTVDWALKNGIETATFHILTPYPGTALFDRMRRDNRLLHSDWDLYDTRHSVFQPANMTTNQLESGYWKAYKDFYKWTSIFKSAKAKATLLGSLRHIAYAGGWKKFDPLWHLLIRLNRHTGMLPLLEKILSGFTSVSYKDIPTRENEMSQDDESPNRLML
ncbi:MAG: radical SAM protein, partial [Spirochaetota bacterium]|nr:radical SAM protein [Spirochaetota bacterium]